MYDLNKLFFIFIFHATTLTTLSDSHHWQCARNIATVFSLCIVNLRVKASRLVAVTIVAPKLSIRRFPFDSQNAQKIHSNI